MLNPFHQGKKIAITGTFGSGKSVFMLSLLHNLHHLDPQNFRLGDKRAKTPISIKSIRGLPLKEEHQAFPYRVFVKKLIKPGGGNWPNRVHSIQRYRCAYRRSDRLKRQGIDLMSFPLERLIDLPIVRTERYSDWSDSVLYQIDQDSKASRQARQYIQHLDAPEIQTERLTQVYKNLLTQFIFDYKTFVAPSSFMIDLNGSRIDGGAPEVVSQYRYVGLPPVDRERSREFIPLSGIARMRVPQFVEDQEASYQLYRSQILKPLFKEVNECETLIILFDIPSILASGRAALDEQYWLLNQLKLLLRGKKRTGQVLGKSNISKVALVANKADLVRTFERDARLPSLLRQLTDEFVEVLHPHVQVGRFICSPCVATRPHSDPERLIGRLIHNAKNPERIDRPFDVPEVPRYWPTEFQARDYPFYKVWPPALQAHQKQPDHHRLDDICRFILDS